MDGPRILKCTTCEFWIESIVEEKGGLKSRLLSVKNNILRKFFKKGEEHASKKALKMKHRIFEGQSLRLLDRLEYFNEGAVYYCHQLRDVGKDKLKLLNVVFEGEMIQQYWEHQSLFYIFDESMSQVLARFRLKNKCFVKAMVEIPTAKKSEDERYVRSTYLVYVEKIAGNREETRGHTAL